MGNRPCCPQAWPSISLVDPQPLFDVTYSKFQVPCRFTKGECQLRIISVNDVYELDNLPRLKTLVSAASVGLPRENVVVALAGDFLAPSLLSSLDAGRGMVRILNDIPVDYVCFGNHEQDVPYPKLIQRTREFQGKWLNSNMPDFKPTLPVHHTRLLTGTDGMAGARKVAFTGFCIGGGKFKAVYRDGAFGGAAETMVPPCDAAPMVIAELLGADPELDEVIPLTHQDLQEDVQMANMGLFPVIVAGHDHEVIHEVHGVRNTPVVKAGMDAQVAALIDLSWSASPVDPVKVSVVFKDPADYEPDPELVRVIETINRPVRELESAMLYELTPDEMLSSVGVKFQESTMAQKVATAVRDCLKCDAAVINSGAVRGNKKYTKCISYGDLKKECPYPSPMVVVPMPFAVLRDAVRLSRRPWWDIGEDEQPREATSALQVDYGMRVGPDHMPVTICDGPPELDRLYAIGCDTRVLRRNQVLVDYCAEFPERIPPDDAGRPVLPILVEFFCGTIWHRLCERANCMLGPVKGVEQMMELFDLDRNGCIDAQELTAALQTHFGELLSSRIIVEQMIAMMDEDGNGTLSESELRKGLQRFLYASSGPTQPQSM